MTRTRVRAGLGLLAAGLLLGACATGNAQKGVTVSGETLLQAGRQLVVTATAFKAGCAPGGAIARADCERFGAFEREFKRAYPAAVEAWLTASDAAAARSAMAAIAPLLADLAQFAGLIVDAYGGK